MMMKGAARVRLPAGVAGLLALVACAPALREPPPVTSLGASSARAAVEGAKPEDVDRLLTQAEANFARRPDASAVRASYDLFLSAARADERRVEGLLGAARTSAWLIEHEHEAPRRDRLATEGVQACQWCLRRAPANVECKYRLALSLGLQARERRTTASDALSKMVSLLEEVIAVDPRLDDAGGHRVLGLVLLRAPGWPAGPGDQDAALEHARKADEICPDNADNLMVLGEALAATGSPGQARTIYTRAEAIAREKAAAGDPDAREVVEAAVKALKALR
jgi:tetratricopeptide (TPR) repeat protein